MTWESVYEFFRIKDFIYFISSPELQDKLFAVKLIFVSFAVFFFIFVIYFMINSSWLQNKFLEDVTEFFAWQSYGQKQLTKRWDKIKKRIESDAEADFKLAIIDADDFLAIVLDERGYEGKDFEESLQMAARLLGPLLKDVLRAHETRNSIVYDPDFKILPDQAKKILEIYEAAVKAVGL